jgi:general secretion pathway protein E
MASVAAEQVGQVQLVAVNAPERPPLCGLLVDAGKLESTDVDRALRLQKEQDTWERIGSILVKLGMVSDTDVAQSLAGQLGLELVDRADYPDGAVGATPITRRFLEKHKTLVLDEDERELIVAMADPLDAYVIEALSLRCRKHIVPRMAVPSEIEAALTRSRNSRARRRSSSSSTS